MSFKEDYSFLEKVSLGAVGNKKIMELLNNAGHRIIELERYSTTNKIWSTKIKRLRVPDLLCLNCGRRIESRAKSKLGIIMSDAVNNPERRWDVGLRDEDLVGIIHCHGSLDTEFVCGNQVNLFSIGDLRSKINHSKLGDRKSASEGSERDRTWPSYVPTFTGRVDSIEPNKIKFVKQDNQRHTYRVRENYNIYVNSGDIIYANEQIIASVIDRKVALECDGRQYDFPIDLKSDSPIERYCAVKALGYLTEIKDRSIPDLIQLLDHEDDQRIKLEIFSSLLRLGEDRWLQFFDYIGSIGEIAMEMEAVLILSELSSFAQSQEKLLNIAYDITKHNEVRSVAVWALGKISDKQSDILNLIEDNDIVVSSHAIAILEKYATPALTPRLLEFLSNNRCTSGIARIISTATNLDDLMIVNALVSTQNETVRKWILYAIGSSSPERFRPLIEDNDPNSARSIELLNIFWLKHYEGLSKEITKLVDFIEYQD